MLFADSCLEVVGTFCGILRNNPYKRVTSEDHQFKSKFDTKTGGKHLSRTVSCTVYIGLKEVFQHRG